MKHTVLFLALVGLLSAGLSGCFGSDPGATGTGDDGVERAKGAKTVEHVPPGNYSFDGQFSQVVAQGQYTELPFEHTLIASELDGVEIEIGVWRPDVPEGEQVPIILQASPYYGNLGAPMEKRPGIVFSYIENFVQHGYAVAAVSVRGTGASGGCMDLMGVKEIADLDQAVTWLADQPWSDGNIGMIGLSYDGSTPWSVAATGNPALKTIVPISGVPDVYGLMFRNGSAESRGPILLNALYYAFFVRAYLPSDFPPAEPPVYAIDKSLEGAICPESFTGFGASLYSGATGDRDPLGWWDERNRIPPVNENYKGSVYSIQGMQDWNVDPHMVIPWVDELNQSGLKTKQLLGQWGHAYPDSYCPNLESSNHDTCRWDWAESLLKWFDSELKGLPVDTGPAVQVQDAITRHWRSEETYPPRDATWTTYHLADGQRLALEPGAAGDVLLTATGLMSDMPSDDQTKSSLPGYKADFTSEAFQNDTLVAGLPRFHVTVTPQGPGGHLAAHLYDVAPNGEETLIGWTQINLAFADGTEEMQPVVPGEQLLAKMEFQPMDATIEDGHSLRVRVWESTYSDRLPTVPPSPVTVHFGGQATSVLEIPNVDRGPEAFFTPPFPADDPVVR